MRGIAMIKRKKIHHLLLLMLCFLCMLTTPAFSGTAKAAKSTGSTSAKVYKNKLRKENGKYYYYNSKGKKVKKCWKTIKKKTYYFQKDGSAATGATIISKKRYLFSGQGVLMKNRFVTYGADTYYANAKGIAVTGIKTIKKKYYGFTSQGIMRKGWYTYKKTNTYYFSQKTGAAYTGWKTIDGKKYYFNSQGKMQKNTWVGSKYLAKDGVYDSSKKLTLATLQTKLKKAMNSYSGTWSIYVKNLNTGESITINNKKMYAASLIKLYAMGAAYQKIKNGSVKESRVSGTISNMITVSSNDAFNSIISTVGKSYVNSWCKSNGFTQTNEGHGLMPAGNYGSHLSNGSGSNMTSVRDCGAFLEKVYNGTLVSKSASNKMLKYLKKQTRRSKIPAGVPSGVTVANKTGETDDYTHDAAIVYSKGATYIICVMAKCPGYAWSAAGNVKKLSRIVYNYFN